MSLFDRLARVAVTPELRRRFERALAVRGVIEFPRVEQAPDAADALDARLETRAALLKAFRPASRPWALAAAVLLAALSFLYIYEPPRPPVAVAAAPQPALDESAARRLLIEEARLRDAARSSERARLARVLAGAEAARADDERRLWPAARTDAERRSALATLARLGAADEIYHIALEDRDTRGYALYTLVTMDGSAETIRRALAHRRLRDDMAVMIRETPSPAALDGLRLAFDEPGETGVAAIRLAGELRDRGSVPLLEALARRRAPPAAAAASLDSSVTPESLVQSDGRTRAARDALRRIGAF